MLPRLWGNLNETNKPNGSLEDNGTGKMSGIDKESLAYLKDMGISYVWYTGIIRHSTKSASEGCSPSNPQCVKGEAGSPYSITDYYDVNPYLADDPDNRMTEFESLIKRTHDERLKVIIDFVPNHVARDYGQNPSYLNRPVLGKTDDKNCHWKADNDFFYYPGKTLSMPNTNDFAAERNALLSGNFDFPYRIIPTWLAEAGGKAGKGTQSFAELMEQSGPILNNYFENPAKATGNDYTPDPSTMDWFDTIRINYCSFHTGTWDKMYDIVRFWAEKGVDGFRCDMVELVPSEFFKWLIPKIKTEFKDVIFIGEVYDKDQYSKYIHSVGFDFLYDKSGLYDTLRAITVKNLNDSGTPVDLWQSTKSITWNWQSLHDLQPYMLNFIENHDEQRFASDFFGKDASNTFAALYVSLFLNTAPFMVYAGEEAGEKGMDSEGYSDRNGRTSIFDWWSVKSLRDIYKSIHNESNNGEDCMKSRFISTIRFAATNPVITKGTSYDLCYCNYSSDGFDENKHYAFLRHYGKETILFFSNFGTSTANADIFIPKDAFDYFGIQETDELNCKKPVKVSAEGMGAVMISLTNSR